MLVSFLPLFVLNFVGAAALTFFLKEVRKFSGFETMAFQESISLLKKAVFFGESVLQITELC